MVSIFIDTIEGYGKSKETLGDLLKDYREDIVIHELQKGMIISIMSE